MKRLKQKTAFSAALSKTNDVWLLAGAITAEHLFGFVHGDKCAGVHLADPVQQTVQMLALGDRADDGNGTRLTESLKLGDAIPEGRE